MSIKIKNRNALTGGGVRALDADSVATLSDGDRAIVWDGDIVRMYQFDATGTDAELSPVVIRPDDFSTAGVWRMMYWPDNEPVGVVKMFPRSTLPSQYLECNGALLNIASYPELYAVIGAAYGGDGVTTFALPDIRGRFVRGWDHGAGRDPDAATRTDRGDGTAADNVGTVQSGATALPNTDFTTNDNGNHRHTSAADSSDSDIYVGAGSPYVAGGTGNYTGYAGTHGHTVSAGGDDETRPVNINMMFIIKYE